MKIYIIITIALLHNLISYSQTEIQASQGTLYKIQGTITDKVTKDTLYGVIVELMNKDYTPIKTTTSDFDGIYVSSFCSKWLINDTLLIKTTKAFYKQEIFYYKINSDSIIDISLDKNKTFSKEKFQEYGEKVRYFRECGLVEDDEVDKIRYQMNKTYYHYCSGEKRKYRDLIDGNENLLEWILTKKKEQ